MGASYQSDGTLHGTLNVTTVLCDQTANTCTITVPAPSVALVFLTPQALANSTPDPNAPVFSTTAVPGATQTSISPEALETSNGGRNNGREHLKITIRL